jgi:Tfp pilus assembly protein PilF
MALRPSPASYYNRGLAHIKLVQVRNAAEDFSRAISIDPNLAVAMQDPLFARSRVDRAIAYTALGKYWKAVDDCNVVLQLEPANADAYFLRATAREKLGKHNLTVEGMALTK